MHIVKEAWRLKTPTNANLTHGADHIRDTKSRIWWEGLKSFSSVDRHLGDTKHR
jgi:hypothetical protein